MAIGANSYSSLSDVEAQVGRYTDEGKFTATTQPTRTQVERFIDRVSAIVNVVLAQEGFTIPVTQADAVAALADFVAFQVTQLCHAANSAGPYAPGSESLRGMLPRTAIIQDATDFVTSFAAGLESLGATRTSSLTNGLGCRTQDEAGNDLAPPFQRGMISNEIPDWDPA